MHPVSNGRATQFFINLFHRPAIAAHQHKVMRYDISQLGQGLNDAQGVFSRANRPRRKNIRCIANAQFFEQLRTTIIRRCNKMRRNTLMNNTDAIGNTAANIRQDSATLSACADIPKPSKKQDIVTAKNFFIDIPLVIFEFWSAYDYRHFGC